MNLLLYIVLHVFSLSSICSCLSHSPLFFFFFFNDTATTEIYTLSLHDALPISQHLHLWQVVLPGRPVSTFGFTRQNRSRRQDRKSTRLNSSHQIISYAVFCLKKKKKNNRSDNSTSVMIIQD